MMGRTNWRAGARAMPCPASPTYNIDQHLLNKATLLHGMTTMKATLNAPHGIIYSFKIIGIRGGGNFHLRGLSAVKCLQAA